ncbi:MAG: hypothetical protein ACYDCW_01725 [Acidithiobacillus ferrivorans]|jgi:hypothetical protein
MGHSWIFWGAVTLALMIGLLMVPGIREILKAAFGNLLIPALSVIFVTTFRWMIWAIKEILEAHLILMKNLFSPRRAIYPTLEEPDQDG